MSGTATWGPWIGVPRERATICAVLGCNEPGKSHPCPFDASWHHHGCVHYDCPAAPTPERLGVTFRDGWGLLCETHYQAILSAMEPQ